MTTNFDGIESRGGRLGRLVHGTPITPAHLLEQLAGHSFCVSYADPRQARRCAELVGREGVLILDNGAFSVWRQGGELDVSGFWRWANEIQADCPQAVAVIPDVIGGEDSDNWLEAAKAIRGGLADYPERCMYVWHMNDPLERLRDACRLFNFVAIGSCAEYDIQNKRGPFIERLRTAAAVIQAVEYRWQRRPWVHVMRGLGRYAEFCCFDSADSTNIARNHNRYKGEAGHVADFAQRLEAKLEARIAAQAAQRKAIDLPIAV